jgi:pSer/pThr/pTyr-binding forkhead associated (FHA) protein
MAGPNHLPGSMRQSDYSGRDGAVIFRSAQGALTLPQRRHGPGQQVSRNDNAQTSDEPTGDTTYAFPAHLLGELDAPAAVGVEPRDPSVEGPPSRSARLLVMRGPNAGSQFLLDQAVTSAGRHPDSDIFLDDVTVSRHHVEFRLENGQFLLVDLDSLNNTYVNREPVHSAVLVDGDEVQIGKFRLMFLTRPTKG